MTAADDQIREDDLARTQMTFGEHLEELRSRVVKALLASLVGLIVAFVYATDLFQIVTRPFTTVMQDIGQRTTLVASAPTQGFFSHVKVAFIVGLICTGPIWIHQIWQFIGAGLYKRERRMVYRYAPMCLLLFVAGVVFGYFVLIPLGLRWLLTFAPPSSIENLITVAEYLRLFTLLTLVLGIAFQLPVVMLGLVKLGITTPATLRDKRKYAIVGMFVAAALLTPPDPVTQVLLAMPLLALYQLGLVLAWVGMGSYRPPLDWPGLWRFWRKILIVLLVAFLFRETLIGIYKQGRIDDDLVTEDRPDRPPVLRVGSELLGRQVSAAYRVSDDGTHSRWVLAAADRAFVIDLERRRDEFSIVDRKQAAGGQPAIVFEHHPQGKLLYQMDLPREVAWKSFMPALLEAFELGDDEARTSLRTILERLTGQRPGGDEESALAAFREWYESRKDGSLNQKDG